MSLANSFDVKDPQDFLRGLSNALNEYDQNKDDGERLKMVRLIFPCTSPCDLHRHRLCGLRAVGVILCREQRLGLNPNCQSSEQLYSVFLLAFLTAYKI